MNYKSKDYKATNCRTISSWVTRNNNEKRVFKYSFYETYLKINFSNSQLKFLSSNTSSIYKIFLVKPITTYANCYLEKNNILSNIKANKNIGVFYCWVNNTTNSVILVVIKI